MNLAFKSAALAGGLFSKLVAWKTGGFFSHVELWMAGPRENAVCFSSREPRGTGYMNIDLSAPLYTCIEINATPAEMDAVRWFAEGTGFKRYDWLGILGFVIKKREHDAARVFCSEWCTLAMQRCLGILIEDGKGSVVLPWTTSPSALFDLAGRKSAANVTTG